MNNNEKISVVFIHGFLGSNANWFKVIPMLRQKLDDGKYEFMAVDLLWHSRANINFEFNINNSSTPLLDAMTKHLESQLPDKPFIAIAHSFGIRPLLKFAKMYPNQVLTMIIEDSSPKLSDSGYKFLNSILTETPKVFSSKEEAREFFDNKYSKGVLARFLLSNIGGTKESGFSWRFNSEKLKKLLDESIENDLWDEWESYPGKISLLLGEDSTTVSADVLRKIKKLRDSNDLLDIQTFHQTGHWIHYEKVEQFVDCLFRIIRTY